MNFDAEDFFTDRKGLINGLEKSLADSFKGKGVNPYIYNILPAIDASPQQTNIINKNQKFG